MKRLLFFMTMPVLATQTCTININLDNDPNVFTLSEKQALFSYNTSKLVSYIYQRGYYCTLGEVYRTVEQAALYAKEGKGIKNSMHCKKLAVDITLFKPGNAKPCDVKDYAQFGAYWKSLDKRNKWGGDFIKNGKKWPDSDHFEMD
jgi:hypothetical protein